MEPEATASPGLAGKIEHDLSGYDAVMTPDEVSRVLHVTPKCIRDMCASGKLVAVKVGKLWRIPKPALVEYMSGSQAGIT